ncbi:MAG: hypothetical protein V1834_00755 [Candidatus Micrarchaeota archaeon]
MVKQRVKALWGYYKTAHQTRFQFYNLTWRVIVVLLAALSMFFIYDYLTWKYTFPVVLSGASFLLADKLFYWFMVGVFFGIVAMGLIYEGEYLINLNKFGKEVEKETIRAIGLLAQKGGKKNVKKRGGRK